MVDNPYLTTEEKLGNPESIESKPIIPGREAAPPVPNEMPQFFSGSLAPQLQHDSSFVGTEVASPRVPKTSLMPLGLQASGFTNAAVQSTAQTTVESAAPQADDDLIVVNKQTVTAYTVAESDFNKVISINNAAGGTIFLPPVAGTTGFSVNNPDSGIGGAFFNGSNTTVVGNVATSVASHTVTGSPINAGDFMFLALRHTIPPGGGVSYVLTDSTGNTWSFISQAEDDGVGGADTISIFYVRAAIAVAVGASITLTLVATFSSSPSNPGVNAFWNTTGLKSFDVSAQRTGSTPATGPFTFSSGGVTTTNSDVYFALGGTTYNGLLTSAPAAVQGILWSQVLGPSPYDYLVGAVAGSIDAVYSATGQGVVKAYASILVAFVTAQPADIIRFQNDFFCYIENTGTGTFKLVSSVPIDGSTTPVSVGTNQGLLLVYDAPSNSWFTVRGMGGGSGGTVTHTAGPLTSGQLIIGNGAADIKVGDLSGDVTTAGTTAATVAKIQGVPVDSVGPTDQQFLVFSSATGKWEPTTITASPFGVFYLDNAASPIGGGYLTLITSFPTTAEQTVTAVGNNGSGQVLAAAWASSALNVTTIAEGQWTPSIFAAVDSLTQGPEMIIKLFKRTSSGTETQLGSDVVVILTATAVTLYEPTVQLPLVSVNPTDVLVVKVYLLAGGASTRTLTVYYDGSTHVSHVHTPIQAVNYLLAEPVDARTTTSEAILDSDRGKLVKFSNTSAVAATIAQAGASGLFLNGWFCDVVNENTGTVTLTPTTSTIDGNATLVLERGEGVRIVSDGTNYFTVAGQPTQDTPNDAEILTFEAATKRWRSKSIGAVSGANASSIRGIAVASSASAPGNQDVLQYSSANNDWEPVLIDGMEHGERIWPSDPSFFDLRDDFTSWMTTTGFPTSATTAGWGSLGWSFLGTVASVTGASSNILQTFGGLPPHQGILGWSGNNTRQNYGHLMINNANNGSGNFRTNGMALMDNVGWKAVWVFKFESDRSSSNALPRFQKRSLYIGFQGSGNLDVASGTTSARPACFYGLRYDTSNVPNAMSVTSVANAAAGSTVYTGSFASATANAWKGMNVTIRGCENGANNGTFACTASTTTTLTLSNAGGVAETVNNGSGAALPASLNITSVANASGGNTTYTVQDPLGFTQGTNGGWIGLSFVVTGCTNGANNGTFTCVGSTATTVILNNASGVAETPTANAAFATAQTQLADTTFKFEVVQNQQYQSGARKDAAGTVSDTSITPIKGNWYRFEISCTVSGQLDMKLVDENNATNFSHSFTSIAQQVVTSGSIAWTSNADGVLRVAIAGAGTPTGALAANAGFLQAGVGTKLTISGLTSPLTGLNATWEISGIIDNGGAGPVITIDGVPVNLNTTQTGTLTYYPALCPLIVWGNDDSGNGGVLGAVNMMLDFFALTWNKAIASPSTVPDATKSRYW